MNIIEFSIACKLISSKLKNVEVPKQLPPTLIASLQHIGTPIRTPTGAMSPTEGYKQFLTQQPVQVQPISVPIHQQQPLVASIQPQQQQFQSQQQQPLIQNQQQPLMMQAQPIMMPQQSIVPQHVMPVAAQSIIPQQMMIANQMPQQMIVQPQPIMTNNLIQNTPMAAAIIPQIPQAEQLSSGSLLDSLAQITAAPPIHGQQVPAAPTPPSGNASRSMSFSEKVPSIPESP